MESKYVDHLRQIFARNRQKMLLVDVRSQQQYTYAQFLESSLAMATRLRQEGVRPGDQVIFSMENCAELAILYFACLHLNAAILPINPAFHPNDYAKLLRDSNASLMIVSPSVRAGIEEMLAGFPALKVLCLLPGVEPKKEKTRHLVNFDFAEALAAAQPWDAPFGQAEDEDVLLTMPTSGSTSAPKVINICYRGLIGNGLAFAERLGLGTENRFYNVLPMTYLGGFYNLLLIPILAEGSVALDGAFGVPNVYGFWENVKTYHVNTLWFTATMLSMLLSLEEDEDLSFLKQQIRVGLCGMAPLSANVKKRFEERFGFFLYENYALSETTFLTTHVPGRAYKEGSVGLPMDGIEVEVVDGDLRPLPPGKDGQIVVRTPYMMKGYRQGAEADRKNLLADGRFLTGDLGRFDEDGELFITGRVKDLIIRGGVNISPRAIEDAFYRIDAVEEVAVVGVPHAVYGEEVAAAIKLKSAYKGKFTIDDARHYCERTIAHFQRPKLIYFIDELPKGATNKIHKAALRHMIQKKVDPVSA
jgi:long-chain acyl-CoA synthetase